jgi:hypothetical protein
MLHTIITFVNTHEKLIGLIFGSAGGLSLALESLLLKLKRSRWHVDSKKLALTLLHMFTLASTGATYVLANVSSEKAAGMYASLTILAELWHRFAINPAYNRWVIPFLDWLSTRKDSKVLPNENQTSTVSQPQSLDPSGSVSPEQFLGND